MGGIGVITNPRSRRNRRNPALARQLAYVLGEQGQLAAPHDFDALHRVAEHFKERQIDILAVNGGDGTTHVALTAFKKVYGDDPLPQVALLRGGTMNTMASGMGIRGRPDQLLGQLVQAYHSGTPMRTTERNALLVNDQVGFLFGNGMLSNFLEVYYAGSEPSPIKGARLLAQALFSTLVGGGFSRRLRRRVKLRVTVDGHTWDNDDWLTIAIGTVDNIGLQFRPFPRVVSRPGHLEILGVSASLGELARKLPAIRLGRQLNHPSFPNAVAKEVILESEESLGFMVDGDFHHAGQRLEICPGPRITFTWA
jgi:diacylglycerol kinase (ATP)